MEIDIENSKKALMKIESLTDKLTYCKDTFKEYKGDRLSVLNIPTTVYENCIDPFIKDHEKEYNTFIHNVYQVTHFEFLKNEFSPKLTKAIDKVFVIEKEIKNVEWYINKYGSEIIEQYKLGNTNDTLHTFFGNETECLGRKLFYLPYLIDLLKALPPQQNETKTDKLKAPVLGLFCSLINKIGIDKRDETESATVYCERICGKFKLPYTDRVRQNYSVNETKKLIQELTEKVLPLIDNETKNLVEKYLDNKQSPKQNLYA